MDEYQTNVNTQQTNTQIQTQPQPQAEPQPQPSNQPKRKSNKLLWIVIVVAVLAVAAAGGGVYYYMDQQSKNDKSVSEKRISDLNAQLSKLQGTTSATTTTTTGGSTTNKTISLTDTEALNYLSIAKEGADQSTTKTYAPIIEVKDSEWAITHVIALDRSSADGWGIVARDYYQVLWRKVNGVWTYVGFNAGITQSWSKEVQDLYSVIPTTIIPEPRHMGDYSQ